MRAIEFRRRVQNVGYYFIGREKSAIRRHNGRTPKYDIVNLVRIVQSAHEIERA